MFCAIVVMCCGFVESSYRRAAKYHSKRISRQHPCTVRLRGGAASPCLSRVRGIWWKLDGVRCKTGNLGFLLLAAPVTVESTLSGISFVVAFAAGLARVIVERGQWQACHDLLRWTSFLAAASETCQRRAAQESFSCRAATRARYRPDSEAEAVPAALTAQARHPFKKRAAYATHGTSAANAGQTGRCLCPKRRRKRRALGEAPRWRGHGTMSLRVDDAQP